MVPPLPVLVTTGTVFVVDGLAGNVTPLTFPTTTAFEPVVAASPVSSAKAMASWGTKEMVAPPVYPDPGFVIVKRLTWPFQNDAEQVAPLPPLTGKIRHPGAFR